MGAKAFAEVKRLSCDFSRSEALLGKEKIQSLGGKSVLLLGLGGVGSFTAEALVRSGVGKLTFLDSDSVSPSNINRQLYALKDTVGKPKTLLAKERTLQINPECTVEIIDKFYLPENADELDLTQFDYVADAIDTVSAKLELAKRCEDLGVPLISCMGTGNKTDPTLLRVSDISKTSGCPLCRVMRRELRARGVKKLKCIWSPEEPAKPVQSIDSGSPSRHAPASMIFVPACAGILMAKEIILDLTNERLTNYE